MRAKRTYVQSADGLVEADCDRCGDRFKARLDEGWTPHADNAFSCVRCKALKAMPLEELPTLGKAQRNPG